MHHFMLRTTLINKITTTDDAVDKLALSKVGGGTETKVHSCWAGGKYLCGGCGTIVDCELLNSTGGEFNVYLVNLF